MKALYFRRRRRIELKFERLEWFKGHAKEAYFTLLMFFGRKKGSTNKSRVQHLLAKFGRREVWMEVDFGKERVLTEIFKIVD